MSFINFNDIPLDLRTPGTFVEFDNSNAVRGLALMPHKILVIGQKLATGIAPANTPIQIFSEAQAAVLAGRGSIGYLMVQALRRTNKTTETWAIFLDDADAGAKAAGSFAFTAVGAVSGTLSRYIGGQPVKIAVTTAMTAAQIATAFAAAVNAAGDLPAVAVVDAEVTTKVNITAKHKGLAGNDISLRTNYYSDEVDPVGVSDVITPMAGGTTNPDITAVFAGIGAEWYTTMAMPYTDAANLTILEAELKTRSGPMKMIDTIAYACSVGVQGTLAAFGLTRNSPFVSTLGVKAPLDTPWEWAAAYAGAAAFAAGIDPAQPVSDIALTGLKAPAIGDRFLREERDILLHNGIATWVVDASGAVTLERAITMYRVDTHGLVDTSYLDSETLRTLSYLRYTMRARFSQRFKRKKLGKDGTPGPNVVTPKQIRGELIALFLDWQELGLVQDIDQFKRDLIVEISATDPNRVNILIPAHVINQLRVLAGQIQFIL